MPCIILHEQVNVFNDVVINIFSNFEPNKIIEIDDRDPPWINNFIKNKIKEKNRAFKLYKNSRMGSNFSNFQKLSNELSDLITKRKEDYNRHLANKLNDPRSSPKLSGKSSKLLIMGIRYH